MPIPTAAGVAGVNRLLEILPRGDRERLLTRSEPVTLAFADILAEQGGSLRHVYFPTSSFISMITSVDGCSNLEVGLAGREGMLGATAALGIHSSPTHAVVQGAGMALRMEIAAFADELERSPALRSVLMRYLYVTIEQLAQTAACTRFHVVEARLARWLLMTHDRAGSDTLDITHEFLAYMLGVRRVGINGAASALQEQELIHYRRGHVTITNRGGLEGAACGCYAADNATYERLLSSPSM